MTLVRMRELRELPDEDLDRRIGQIEQDLLRERGVAAMGGAPASPGHLRALRTDLARALTVKTERRNAALGAASRGASPAQTAPS
jgi:large subunit ribosomal protein L29